MCEKHFQLYLLGNEIQLNLPSHFAESNPRILQKSRQESEPTQETHSSLEAYNTFMNATPRMFPFKQRQWGYRTKVLPRML